MGTCGEVRGRSGRRRRTRGEASSADRRRAPVGLEDAKLLLLVDRASGGMLGVTLFASEEALRRGDEAMNAGPGNAGSRSSVDFYEVPVQTL